MNGTHRWTAALRAGLVTYLLATFAILLVLIPWHAAHSEFPGHHHPAGTPDHVHGLHQVVGWLLLAPVLVVVMDDRPRQIEWRIRAESWQEQLHPPSFNAQRAPPAGLTA